MLRRTVLTALAGAPALLAAGEALARSPLPIDPQAPVGGNPKGDVTIVAFFDYNCVYCKKAAPDLDRIVAEDGRIRLVYLDWPILTKASVYGALVALAAKRQGKYEAVYRALIALPGGRVSEDEMRAALAATGADLDRLQRDADAHKTGIIAQIKRNAALAQKLGLQGTPTYVIGSGVASTLDYEGFKAAVAEARARGGR
jgi:protein-disulfide isomerase